jgi:phospholipase D1/2
MVLQETKKRDNVIVLCLLDTVDRHEHPRMPWQDIGACVFGDGARDVARHFVQRWNFIKTEKKKSFAGYPLLLPRDGSLPLNDESDPLTNLLKESVNCEIQVRLEAVKQIV